MMHRAIRCVARTAAAWPCRRTGRTACCSQAALRPAAGTSSSLLSEAVTRSILGTSGALIRLGVPPVGVAAFASVGPVDNERLPSSVRVTVPALPGELAELLSDALLGLGAQSVVVEEALEEGASEQQRYGPDAELWDSCRVLVHFGLEADVDSLMSQARCILELSPEQLQYNSEPVVDEAWVEQIKASYVPVAVSEQLHIVPEWSEPMRLDVVNIRLTPGVAFGTGEHPTTRLCLQHLEALAAGPLRGARVLDYGCGSGVLAIAALLLGAESAAGTDTDPLAVRAAAANAELNGVQEKLTLVRCGPSLDDPDPMQEEHGCFDVVVANILRGPLLELQPRLTACCKPGGALALSGILTEQAADVVTAYEGYFTDFAVTSEGGWALVTAKRRATDM